jgi:hypothetical protein
VRGSIRLGGDRLRVSMAHAVFLCLFLCLLSLLGVEAQQTTARSCSACAGQQAGPGTCFNNLIGTPCVWCSGGFCDQGGSPFTCNGGPTITNAAQCPPNPPPIDAALLTSRFGAPGALGALGLLALLVLGLFVYSPMEGLPGSPPASTPVSPAALHILFAAAVLLWFATGLFLAVPSVPWMYLSQSTDPNSPFATVFTAFTAYSCSYRNSPGSVNFFFCTSTQLQDALENPNIIPRSGTAPAAAIAATASALAVCGACTTRVSCTLFSSDTVPGPASHHAGGGGARGPPPPPPSPPPLPPQRTFSLSPRFCPRPSSPASLPTA